MRSTRWFKLMVTVAALGLIAATGSAQAANALTKSTSNQALGYCSPAPQPAAGNALPSRSAAGELCSEASPAHAPTTGGWHIAGPADERSTPSLVAFVAQVATWGDVGVGRR